MFFSDENLDKKAIMFLNNILKKRVVLATVMFSGVLFLAVSCNKDATVDEALTRYTNQSTSLFTSDVNDLDVIFTNYSVGITDYLWDFGDGNTSTEESPTHTYDDYGNYTVTLTTTNTDGETTVSEREITTSVISFTYELVDNVATFTNGSASASTFSWDFGDGTEEGVSTDENPTYAYTAAGDYTVTLIGLDDSGLELGSFSQEVTGVIIPVVGGGVQGDPVTIDGYDFEPVDGSNSGGYTFWRWTDREGYSNNPYSSTSDGFVDRGAKWEDAHSRLGSSVGDMRTSYQALNVTPNAKYTLEFYSEVSTAGDYIEVLVLDGHYDTPTAAIASTPLLDASTTDVSGAFVLNSVEFTANATGEIAIMMSAFIADLTAGESVFLDNITLTPVQ